MDDKKIAVFTSVMHLLSKNGSASDITVSDIAETAGIGKGTVYEYFGSKNEILRETVYYFCDRTIDNFKKICNEKADFKERVYACFDIVMSLARDNRKMFRTIVGYFDDSCDCADTDCKKHISALYSELTAILFEICRPGQNSGIIRKNISVHELYYAAVGIMSFISSSLIIPKDFGEEKDKFSKSDLFDFCYSQLLRCLK